MPISQFTAALTQRNGAYALALIGAALALGFLYAFNYTTFFGAVAQ